MSSSGYAAMSPRRPAGAPSEHMYATMTEEELSQSLIYLTCPICEQVFSKEPVFTPCHHTFCSDCIRQRIESGDRTCAECRRPLTLGELQPNTMAINLLSTMKSCCIYRNNGCRWKGLVKDLAAHHKECSFAVTQCPYGCGERVDRTTLRSHQRTCPWRPVNDCPCRTTFRFMDRESHEANCLAFLRQRLPVVTAERDAMGQGLETLHRQLDDLRREGAQQRVEMSSSTAQALLLSLALLSMLGQLVRPDATLAAALVLLVAVTSRDARSLSTLGCLLPLASLAADAAWFVLSIGPGLPHLTYLPTLDLGTPPPEQENEASVAGTAAGGASAQHTDGVRAQLALAYVAAAAMLKLLIMLPHAPLLSALRDATTRDARCHPTTEQDEDDLYPHQQWQQPEQQRFPLLLDASSSSSSSQTGGGRARTHALMSEWSSAPPPTPPAPPPPRTVGESAMEGVGIALLLLSSLSSIARPDAGAALSVLVLCALPESHLYFSRVLLGASALAISIDLAWLHLQAAPELAPAELASLALSPSDALRLLSSMHGRTALGAWTTLLSLPLKVVLLFAAVHLSCISHVAETRPFRFAIPPPPAALSRDETPRSDATSSSTAAGSAAAATAAAAAAAAATAAPAGGQPPFGRALSESARGSARGSGGGAGGAARTRQSASELAAEIARASQLEQAKRGYTLCFLALLLAAGLACLGDLSRDVNLGSPETYVFSLLCCFACMRHSQLCDSTPDRCRAVLNHASVLVGALVLVEGATLALNPSLSGDGWAHLDLKGRVGLAMHVSLLLLLLLLLTTLLHLSRLLLNMTTTVSDGSTFGRLTERSCALAAAGVCLSALASCVRRDLDAAAFFLALFATSYDAEADAAATLAAIDRANASPRSSRAYVYTWGAHHTTPRTPTDDPRLRWKWELASRRGLWCLRPDGERESGGLLTATLLLALTSLADIYWLLLSAASTGAPEHAPPLARSLASASFAFDGAAAASGGGGGGGGAWWAALGAWAATQLRAHLEMVAVLTKLLVKLAFTLSAGRLMLLPRKRRDVAAPPQSGSLLYSICALLLLLAFLLSSYLELLATEGPDADAAHPSTDGASMATGIAPGIAPGLALGPPASLAALGCALALGSGGRRLCVLLCAASLAAAAADLLWLSLGPLEFSLADLAALAEGRAASRWASLPHELLLLAVALLLQAPLKLAIAVGALYRGLFTAETGG